MAPARWRIERSSLERWLVSGADGGRPLSARNAWALIGWPAATRPFLIAASVCWSTRKSFLEPVPAREYL
jgi:hypothetical protein